MFEISGVGLRLGGLSRGLGPNLARKATATLELTTCTREMAAWQSKCQGSSLSPEQPVGSW